MHVLQTLPSISSHSGGPVRSTLANCRALSAVDSDIRLTLAATDQGLEPGWQEQYVQRMPSGMELEIFSGMGRHAFTFSFPLTLWLWRHVPDYDLVVVRSLLNPISSTAAWIARQHKVPYLLVPHGTLSRYTFKHRRTVLKRAYVQLVERRTLTGAAAVRFTSRAEMTEAPSWDAAPPSRVIPHPYESQFSRNELGDRSSYQILFLSRLHPKKGIDTLLEALRIVVAELPATRLVLAGSGAPGFEQHVRLKVRSLKLEDSVELHGFVEGEEKIDLLAKSVIFVLPSRQENFGVAVAEAMDAGLPVVISRSVGIWREVEEAEAGVVVKRSPKSVADALSSLLRDPERRYRMGLNGRELVRTLFAPGVVGPKLAKLYGAIAGIQDV